MEHGYTSCCHGYPNHSQEKAKTAQNTMTGVMAYIVQFRALPKQLHYKIMIFIVSLARW